ncbi:MULTISPECIES: extracellular solute-binding protein [unclassified Paenibacillus]|uniref:extracellular solute-binding protein n=1 Tax=unclassified Paenibacillus TaxID=185978 RepID=UPI0009307B09|nr:MULTISPECIES: extracellular solute-binding protein [unclassified Paenibacillus]
MNKSRWMGLSLAVAVTSVGLLAGCAKEEGGAVNGEAGSSAPAAPTPIKIFLNQQTPEVLPSNNPVLQEIEKRTNTKLQIQWVPSNTLNDKTKVTLASGDIPDLMLITNIFDPQFVTMMKQGAFWDLTPFIKSYPNMSALPEQIWKDASSGGKSYGLPRIRPMEGGGSMPMLRKDWLDKLKLDVPVTMEDMYQVAKAFTQLDPDGNGKNDTFGITGHLEVDHMGSLNWVEQVFTGNTGKWKLIDGQLAPTVFDPGMREALIWMNRLYSEKLITPDFSIMKSTQARDELMAGKAGMLGSAMNPQWLFTEAIRKHTPQGDMLPVVSLTGPYGKFVDKQSGVFGMFVIPKTVPEAKMKKLLEFMDFGYSDEGSDLALYGIKGVHYTEQGDMKIATEQAKTDMVGQNILGQMYGKYEKYQRAFLTGIPADLYERNKKIIDQRAEISKADEAYGLESATYIKVGKDIDKSIQDMKVKVMLGKVPLTDWDKFVSDLKNNNDFKQIIKEMNEAYKNR